MPATNVHVMRILVTNDDGIDSVGLHVLARALRPHGEIVVCAPDSEYSGASAAFGALHLLRPEMLKTHIEGIDQAWAISGPPALCVMLARLGALGQTFDLVVAGINPGANVGRAVYHSGTVGAAITARNGGLTGIAISQAVTTGGVMGQGWDEMIEGQRWDSAAAVAAAAVDELVTNPLDQPGCLNINVPNLDLSDILGWKRTEIGALPTRSMTTVDVEPKQGHEGSYYLKINWGSMQDYPPETDVGAVIEGYVATTWLSTVHATEFAGSHGAENAIARFLSP
ncbi:MAG: 5'/3'-nucleotidase SurE [Acidimicrobiales bacterium]